MKCQKCTDVKQISPLGRCDECQQAEDERIYQSLRENVKEFENEWWRLSSQTANDSRKGTAIT